jgi:hypothetical protein|nr:MAG TPA: hypothetical protein [Caudoviricetes sp.]
MGMKAMYDLRDMLCKELDEITRKGELGAGDLDIAYKLVGTVKNIDKIEMMEDDGGYSRRYSRDGNWEADMRGNYGRDSSYARRGTHYVRGHYSRDSGKDNMKRQLQEMLDEADDDTLRRAIQRCMDAVEG